MKIVLTDAQTVIDDLVNADPLRALGEVTEHGLLAYEEVAEQIADADVVVCNKTLMDAHTLRYAKKLRYIGLFATGYNNIDIDYCRAHGIAVCNAGSYSTNAVAQHTFALILEAYNRTAQYDRYVHSVCTRRLVEAQPDLFAVCLSAQRACRQDARHRRIGRYRNGSCQDRRRLSNAGHRLQPQPQDRGRRGDGFV